MSDTTSETTYHFEPDDDQAIEETLALFRLRTWGSVSMLFFDFPQTRAEAIREGFWVCYECKDDNCSCCIGIPCMCPCPTPPKQCEPEYSI